jgi:hypothetical protein
MKSPLLCSAFLAGMLALGATARAEEPQHVCMSLEKAQKRAGKGTVVLPMTPRQFAFLQGVYVGLPSTPDGLPPGDGAIIIKSDADDSAVLVWTRGPLACDPIALPKAGKLLKYLAVIKAGASADGDDL